MKKTQREIDQDILESQRILEAAKILQKRFGDKAHGMSAIEIDKLVNYGENKTKKVKDLFPAL